jgi:hypothetical protein
MRKCDETMHLKNAPQLAGGSFTESYEVERSLFAILLKIGTTVSETAIACLLNIRFCTADNSMLFFR